MYVFKYLIYFFSLLLVMSFSRIHEDYVQEKILPIYYNDEAFEWADSVINTLTLDQKIAQLFMVAANGKNLKENYYKKIDTLIQNYQIGGIIFFQSKPSEVRSL